MYMVCTLFACGSFQVAKAQSKKKFLFFLYPTIKEKKVKQLLRFNNLKEIFLLLWGVPTATKIVKFPVILQFFFLTS